MATTTSPASTGRRLPTISNASRPNDLDSAVSVDIDLAPNEDRIVRFILGVVFADVER